MRPDQLRREVARIRWFHSIDLGHGIVTPGEDRSARKLRTLELPASLAGRTVLDVGAWDGFFSFEAERRGASRVVAVDPFCWRPPAWGPDGWGTQQGFLLARRALGSRVEDADVDFDDLPTLGTFDVVLFLGVLYHLPEPWRVLERVARAARHLLVIETHVDLLHVRRPAAAHYPGAELAGDESNWWGPNVALLEARLRAARFARIDVVHRERLAYRAARAAYRRLRPPRVRVDQGRCVIHASR